MDRYINIQYQSVPMGIRKSCAWENPLAVWSYKSSNHGNQLDAKSLHQIFHQTLFVKKVSVFLFTFFRKSSQTFKLSRKQTIQNWKNHCDKKNGFTKNIKKPTLKQQNHIPSPFPLQGFNFYPRVFCLGRTCSPTGPCDKMLLHVISWVQGLGRGW